MHRFPAYGKLGRMKVKPKPRKQRTAARRVVDKLLAAVEKSIAAADEARQARDELVRLSAKQGEATPCK